MAKTPEIPEGLLGKLGEDRLPGPADKIVERGNFKAALLNVADLVESGEKIERATPTASIISQDQRLSVSREAIWMGDPGVRKNSDWSPKFGSSVGSQ